MNSQSPSNSFTVAPLGSPIACRHPKYPEAHPVDLCSFGVLTMNFKYIDTPHVTKKNRLVLSHFNRPVFALLSEV